MQRNVSAYYQDVGLQATQYLAQTIDTKTAWWNAKLFFSGLLFIATMHAFFEDSSLLLRLLYLFSAKLSWYVIIHRIQQSDSEKEQNGS